MDLEKTIITKYYKQFKYIKTITPYVTLFMNDHLSTYSDAESNLIVKSQRIFCNHFKINENDVDIICKNIKINGYMFIIRQMSII